MISVINGTILHIEPQNFGSLVDVLTSSGLGYQVLLGDKVEKNMDVLLFITTSFDTNGVPVKTFGYSDPESRQLHNILIQIPGLGNATAFNLISLGVSDIITALQNSDEMFFKKIKGFGPKLVSKLFDFYREKHHLFPSVNRINTNQDLLPTRQEVNTLKLILGIKDINVLEDALIEARANGATGIELYSVAGRIIAQKQ